MFIYNYVISVLGYYHVVFTLYYLSLCVLLVSNFRCKLVKSNSSIKIIITLKLFNILTSSYGISILVLLCTLCNRPSRINTYTSLRDPRASYYHVAFTLYIYIVWGKNRSRSTIFNSLVSTGDSGRQPPLLPPQLAATRVDTIIHNYRPSTSP